ncbi:MAG: RdgB/HAM1 family non-canonical purine NTP pyrophosphatase [Acholeplasmataceae bacterium]|jgi:XTP/dITP diphosphohydrolase|nr:RdgB/HAM1 family non-canonical purine NTP pyrophosphatase [Acholeplasmataceae bacterium]
MFKMLIASQNAHKIRELRQLFKHQHVTLISLKDLNDDEEVEENGESFFDNALKKALYYAKKYNIPSIADDSGLVVHALNGKPGIFSARYSGQGDRANNMKVLAEMKGIEDRKAYFISSIVVGYPNGDFKAYEGKFDGYIAIEAKGSNGFGYDAIFYLPEYQMTAAQIEPELKNRISHRAKAMKLLMEDIDEIINYE